MTKQYEKEVTNLQYISDIDEVEDCTQEIYESLKIEVLRVVEEENEKFREVLGHENYESYNISVKGYVLNATIPVETRKELYDAVIDGKLIGGFA